MHCPKMNGAIRANIHPRHMLGKRFTPETLGSLVASLQRRRFLALIGLAEANLHIPLRGLYTRRMTTLGIGWEFRENNDRHKGGLNVQ